ncbi:hypothetical protein ABE237_10660 [Brevibacillus formosus]|uniref:hypothetical protein n=1 Tax=Brevibacillus TaxID=55080 RepID=UPI000D10CEAD|nr:MULTISPECIES: hypothetical protein [Brevibacillus]MBG9940918.1 hypothetical protein [Brevibacillus formosus]MED1943989.1 hypothetical protein [Brevibacillus formosus]MED1999639.1 hypothetical protein [Brevibacillus formosus]MED2082224.1 hypothetical protein [Brevibacillus formosus]PSK18855.1 hypothetical protein C7R94_08660 [Brevibacillus sp. NRRL NRS-603]
MENTILSGIHQAVGDTPIVHLSRLRKISLDMLLENSQEKKEYSSSHDFLREQMLRMPYSFIHVAP